MTQAIQAARKVSQTTLHRRIRDHTSILGEAETSWNTWQRDFRPTSLGKNILQHVELFASCVICSRFPSFCDIVILARVLRMQLSLSQFCSCNLLHKTHGSLSWALVVSTIVSIIGSLSGMSRYICCASPGNVLSFNTIVTYVFLNNKVSSLPLTHM